MDEIRVLLATHREPVHQKSALATAPEGAHVTICAAARYETVVERIGDADVLVSERSGRIDAPLIRRGRNLRLIQRWGRMTHDIDLGAAREAGVAVCYQPLYNAMMVAEHVVMQILGLAKCVRECEDVLLDPRDWGMEPRQCDANQFAINWSGRRDIMPVLGSTVGIVGFGEIGAELAERLKPFGCRVLYNKRNRLPADVEASLGVTYADRDAIRAASDFLCLLLPHVDSAGGAIGRDFIDGMKPGACLISSGASSTLNEEDVAAAYRGGRLRGVATDGWRWEPLKADNPLLALARDPQANVVFTPHTAIGARPGADMASSFRAGWQNVVNLMQGLPLVNRLC